MAIAQYTITNISGSSITYQGQTLANGDSYTPAASDQSIFASDIGLIAYVLGGAITITIGSFTWSGRIAAEILEAVAAGATTKKYYNQTGNGTHVIKSGAGKLQGICIGNNTTGGTVTLYDNTAGSGTVIMTLTVGTPSGGLLSTTGQLGPNISNNLEIQFATGLTIVTTGSANNNVTILYQ